LIIVLSILASLAAMSYPSIVRQLENNRQMDEAKQLRIKILKKRLDSIEKCVIMKADGIVFYPNGKMTHKTIVLDSGIKVVVKGWSGRVEIIR